MNSFRNLSGQERSPVEDRVFMLSQKINSLKLNKPEQSTRKCEKIENLCDEIQGDFEAFNQYYTEKMFDVRHVLSKIGKQLDTDYLKVDSLVRQQIDATNKKVLELIEEQGEQRRASDERIMKFIDQETSLIRDLLESESRQRQATGIQIEQSLESDMAEIRNKIQQVQDHFHGRMAKINNNFKLNCEKLREELKETGGAYSENQSDFYRMLRDLVKKVKTELSEHQAKREATEEQILTLIEKMCDNAIQNR